LHLPGLATISSVENSGSRLRSIICLTDSEAVELRGAADSVEVEVSFIIEDC